ncbi:MAG: glycosyltransferase family 4 protein [Thermoanaerobaculia bacterium]
MTVLGAPVAILGPAPPDRGGIARETALLAEELARRGPVSYFTFSRQYPRWLDPRRFAEFPDSGTSPAVPLLDWRSPRSWNRTAERIARTRARALLVPWWTAFWGLPVRAVLRRVARADASIRRVLICHNVEDHEATALHRLLTLGALLAADACFVHSESARESLGRLLPGRPVAAHPLPAGEKQRPDREAARRRLGIDGRLVLFLGLVRRYKGVDLLLRAAPRIVAETRARVAIVGESFPDAGDVEKMLTDSLARGEILRRDLYVSEEEMADWLAACDVLVLPYRKIAGSAIAARALAARRPMAASRIGSLAETVVPGVTGELFEPGDAEGLARAVATVLSRGLTAYEPGLEQAAMRSSWRNYVSVLLDFLSHVDRR